ncbi:uncharacterized protein LOC122074259 [Macadamia integrifolia]|uniref:uncharacterized protein LOC122074259 n=1 Tax=Macadamia integrifolia TaxID=60698 RepID=UPI001C4F3DA1|nr:uncharacterized protein LOC122074259 [Macadamia integrifolia]
MSPILMMKMEMFNLKENAIWIGGLNIDQLPHILILEKVWTHIWSCKTLSKIKSFLWRACAQCLASGEGLLSRHVSVDPSCLRCGVAVETVDHLLLECLFALASWFGSSIAFLVPASRPLKLYEFLSSWDSLFSQEQRKATETLGMCSFLYWFLWIARNDLVFRKKIWTPSEMFQSAQRAFSKFWAASSPHNQSSYEAPTALSPPSSWTRPPIGSVKINCNIALPTDFQVGGLGIIIQDCQGA